MPQCLREAGGHEQNVERRLREVFVMSASDTGFDLNFLTLALHHLLGVESHDRVSICFSGSRPVPRARGKEYSYLSIQAGKASTGRLVG